MKSKTTKKKEQDTNQFGEHTHELNKLNDGQVT